MLATADGRVPRPTEVETMSHHLKRCHATQKYAVDKGVAAVPQAQDFHRAPVCDEQQHVHNALTSLTELRSVHGKLHRANLQSMATKQRTGHAKEQARLWLDLGNSFTVGSPEEIARAALLADSEEPLDLHAIVHYTAFPTRGPSMSTHHSPPGHKHTGRSSPTGAAGNAHSLKAIMQGSGIGAQSIGHCHGLQSTSSSSSGLSLGSSARLRQPHGHLAAIGFDPASAMGSDVVGPYYRHSHSGVMSVDGPPGSSSSLGSTPSTVGSGLGPYLSPRTHAKNAASRFSIKFLDGQSNRGSVVSGQGSQSGAAAGLHGQGGTPSPISGTRNGAMSPYQCPSPQPSGDSEGCESEGEGGNDRSFSQSNSSMLGIRAKISPVLINSAKMLEHYMSVSKNEGSASGIANGAAAHALSKRASSDKGLLPRLNCIGKRGSTSVKLLRKRASEGGGDGGCVATAIWDGAGAAAGPWGYSSPGIGPSPALPPLLSNTQRRQTCTSLPPTGAVSVSGAAPQHRLSLSDIGHGGSDDASQGLAHAKDAGSQQSAQARSRHVNFSGSSQEDQHRGSNAGSGAVVSIEEEGAGMGLGRHRPSLAASQQGHRLLRQFDAATTSPSSSKESGPSSGSGGGHQTTTSHKGTGGPLYATHGSAGSRLLVPAGSMKSLMVVGQGSFTGSRDGLQQSLAAASMRRQ